MQPTPPPVQGTNVVLRRLASRVRHLRAPTRAQSETHGVCGATSGVLRVGITQIPTFLWDSLWIPVCLLRTGGVIITFNALSLSLFISLSDSYKFSIQPRLGIGVNPVNAGWWSGFAVIIQCLINGYDLGRNHNPQQASFLKYIFMVIAAWK